MKKCIPNFVVMIAFIFIISRVNAQAILISDFTFDNSLNDMVSNSLITPSGNMQTSFSNNVTDGQFNWVADTVSNQNNSGGGLNLYVPDNLFTEKNYTIAFEVSLTQTSGYRKLIDFNNRGDDEGLYVNDQLRIYSTGGYGDSTLQPNTFYNLVFYRFGDNDSVAVNIFENNTLLPQSNCIDVDSLYVPVLLPGSNRLFGLFHDDSTTLDEYSDTGSVRRVRVWSGIASLQDLNTFNGTKTVQDETVLIYPNPARTQLQVTCKDLSSLSTEICIVNIFGEEVMKTEVTEQHMVIDVLSLARGIYLLRVGGDVTKFLKQ